MLVVVDTGGVTGAAFTTWINTGDVLPLLLVHPLNTAVILCEPTAKVDIVNVAVVPDNVAVPIFTVPSKNVTVPVVVHATETVAVKVTL